MGSCIDIREDNESDRFVAWGLFWRGRTIVGSVTHQPWRLDCDSCFTCSIVHNCNCHFMYFFAFLYVSIFAWCRRLGSLYPRFSCAALLFTFVLFVVQAA